MNYPEVCACSQLASLLYTDFDFCLGCFLNLEGNNAVIEHKLAHKFLACEKEFTDEAEFAISMLSSKDKFLRAVSEYCLKAEISAAEQLVEDIAAIVRLKTAEPELDSSVTPDIKDSILSRLESTLPEAAQYAQAMVDLSLRLRSSVPSLQ